MIRGPVTPSKTNTAGPPPGPAPVMMSGTPSWVTSPIATVIPPGKVPYGARVKRTEPSGLYTFNCVLLAAADSVTGRAGPADVAGADSCDVLPVASSVAVAVKYWLLLPRVACGTVTVNVPWPLALSVT